MLLKKKRDKTQSGKDQNMAKDRDSTGVIALSAELDG